MSAPTTEKPATWLVVAGFMDQVVVDPEKNLRDLAQIQQHEAVEQQSIRIAVVRDDYEDINRVTPAARWDLKGSSPDEVMAAWADAEEIADCLNRSLGQVVS